MRTVVAVFAILASALPCLAAETPPHAIAVMGEAEIVTPPDYATVDVGVITQGANVAPALAENSARMSRVIEALHALGIADKDIQTSNFNIIPKYQKRDSDDYDPYAMRPVTGYSVSNRATVTVTDLTKIAKVVDASVDAGANSSGSVQFRVRDLTGKMDKARQSAIENAHHKALTFTTAAGMKLGRAVSITDNRASTSYDGQAGSNIQLETVVVGGGGRMSTPILTGEMTLICEVTVVYAAN
jgi:uncharacterized protein